MDDSSPSNLKDYLCLFDEEDSDCEDGNWKRAKSSSSSSSSGDARSVRDRIFFDDSESSKTIRSESNLSNRERINIAEEILKQPITRTITRTVSTNQPPNKPIPPSQKSPPSSESVWKRISFPSKNSTREPPPRTTPIKPPLTREENEPSTSAVNKKPITFTTTSTSSGDIKTRLGPIVTQPKEFKTPERSNIPNSLNCMFKTPLAPARPKYHTERGVDLATFVKQIKTEMIFHQSLDRIYNRSLRELPDMKSHPEFRSLLQNVIQGVLFDPEVEINDETGHKILKLLELFELDDSSTWTYLIERCYNLVAADSETHYLRMSKFIEMSFNHLLYKKTRLLPATALSLFKLAQVRPFGLEKKPSPRINIDSLKADLSGLKGG